jgi:hypothetical protein
MRKQPNTLTPYGKNTLSCAVTLLSLCTMVFCISGLKDLLSDDTTPSSSDANFSLQLSPTQELCIGIGSFFTMILVCKCAQSQPNSGHRLQAQLLNHNPVMTKADQYLQDDTKRQARSAFSV